MSEPLDGAFPGFRVRIINRQLRLVRVFGMTRKDYMVGQVLAGLATNVTDLQNFDETEIAKAATKIADRTLKRLDNQAEGEEEALIPTEVLI